MSRRAIAGTGLAAVLLCGALAAMPAVAGGGTGSHGLSAFGERKYGPDFKHFEFVNPDAPKGGRLSQIGPAGRITFDSFNAFILRGDPAQGLDLLFDSLMVRATDEPDAVYGLLARSAAVAPDRRSVTFELRPEARFSDGSPVTAEDVAFSFDTLKAKGHPQYRIAMRDVVRAEVEGDHRVRYDFKGENLRDLPLIVATLPVLSKAYYATRNFEETTLEPPLGSGPYLISEFKQGSFTTFKRRDEYWARDLPVNRGRYNFDEVRFEYFRDRTAQLENLKAGSYDLREEFTSKDWATGYNVPQVKEGRLALLTLPDDSPSGAQGFFINTRRAKFSDPRVRKALDYAFDYEWTNSNLFYSLYKRTASYFENSDLKAAGKPSAEELALLEPYRAQLPPEVFEEPYVPPVSDGSGADRRLLRTAAQLLTQAGWELKGDRRVNKAGEVLDIEFLIYEPTFERVLGPYVKNLQALGIHTAIRRVDPAQYERRVKGFDFDIVTQRYVMRLTPGVELFNFFGSDAAGTDGSFNLAGIKSPVVDALAAKVLEARSRQELVTATRALDRVLRAGHYWVPHWYKASHNIAHWNKFSRPQVKPKYDRGIVDTWWFDAEKAAKL
ncbi:MAG: extracellular solute-binding protein [Hyphomicrobiaceae bacterium]|nr:extracellular solute-binding protein [Hyphomicrobiaceae bacterium]